MSSTIDKTLDLSISNYGTARRQQYDIALLPWGATEPHNLHLPYLTDAILSHDVAVDAAAMARDLYGIRAMVLPAMPLGAQNPGQRELPFCIHYRQETQRAVIADIVASLYHQGLRRMLIINGHGGNTFKGIIRDLAVDYPDMLIGSGEWFKGANAKDYFDHPGDHADELETSAMMYYHPELVNLNEAGHGGDGGFKGEMLSRGVAWIPRDWSRISSDTGIGDPYGASAEKGARFVRACAEAFAKVINEMCQPNLYQD